MTTAAATAAVPRPEKLPVRLKMMHGLGSIAYGVKDNGFSTFLLLFYNQVIGLDAGIVGAAIMMALIADAFVDPVIGELTDRTRSRWGRRLPWLYGAPIPLAIAWMLLWSPPAMSDTMTVAWLIGFAIIVRSLVSMCEVPSVAIVPELTGDYDERTAVMRFRFLFGWGGGLLILLLAYGVFFGGAKGLVDPDGYFPYALAGALMMAGAVLISAAGQHKRIAVSNLTDVKPVMTLRQILGEMRDTLSNRAFLWLIFAALFGFVNQGITFSMNNYLLGFFWQFTQGEMVAYVFLLFASMIAAFVIVAPLSAKLGKRDGAIVAGAIALLVNSGIYFAWIQGVFPGLPGKTQCRDDVRAGVHFQQFFDRPDDPVVVDDGRCRRSVAERDRAAVRRPVLRWIFLHAEMRDRGRHFPRRIDPVLCGFPGERQTGRGWRCSARQSGARLCAVGPRHRPPRTDRDAPFPHLARRS